MAGLSNRMKSLDIRKELGSVEKESAEMVRHPTMVTLGRLPLEDLQVRPTGRPHERPGTRRKICRSVHLR